MLITSGGVMVRTPANEVSWLSRYAQGVRLINLDAGSSLVCAEQIKEIIQDDSVDVLEDKGEGGPADKSGDINGDGGNSGSEGSGGEKGEKGEDGS